MYSIVLICTFIVTASSYYIPTVNVVLLSRNEEYVLPYFLTLFENLNYPKNRMSLFIRSDHNNDSTIHILEEWLSVHEKDYHSVDKVLDKESKFYPGEENPSSWVDTRYKNVIKLKEKGLEQSRNICVDFTWFLDTDIILMEPNTLHILIEEEKPIIAPLLISESNFSNFWGKMDEGYQFNTTKEFFSILQQNKKGCFPVPVIHSCFIVDMRHKVSHNLTFDPIKLKSYEGPHNDVVTFGVSAKKAKVNMFVCNQKLFGYILTPLKENENLTRKFERLVNIKLQLLSNYPSLEVSPLLQKYVTEKGPKDNLGFDQVYLINLARRPDRKKKMLQSFDELGINANIFEAFDWQYLNESIIQDLEIKLLHESDKIEVKITLGLVANFLSHYFVWKDIADNGYKQSMIFEDDVRFLPNFRDNVNSLLNELKRLNLTWDFLYLEREKIHTKKEKKVEGSEILVHPEFSYSLLGYILSDEGARKLIDAKPLGKMIPADSFVPTMFNKFPEKSFKKHFPIRNLRAYSIDPFAVVPTYRKLDAEYVTDTRNSPQIDIHNPKESLLFLVATETLEPIHTEL